MPNLPNTFMFSEGDVVALQDCPNCDKRIQWAEWLDDKRDPAICGMCQYTACTTLKFWRLEDGEWEVMEV